MRPLLTASLLALALGAAACSETAPPPTATPAAAEGARLTLRLQPVDDLKPVAASVVTRDMAQARARIGGTLTELKVREGDQVRKGQLIGRVSDQRLTLETTGYEAQAAAAAAEAARAAAELSRVQVLYDKGFYAKARLEQAQAAARAADPRPLLRPSGPGRRPRRLRRRGRTVGGDDHLGRALAAAGVA
ncbi:MAG: multidrug efflux system membrane fusion protein [Pseudoalteromonas distincta]|jgi:multidrug efflux system membrane fusion protein